MVRVTMEISRRTNTKIGKSKEDNKDKNREIKDKTDKTTNKSLRITKT